MFKVGDKVKLKSHVNFRCKGKILTIIKEAGVNGNRYIHVTYEGLRWGYFPLHPHEIEKVTTKGQQLLFNFME